MYLPENMTDKEKAIIEKLQTVEIRCKRADGKPVKEQYHGYPTNSYSFTLQSVKCDSKGIYVEWGSWSANFWFTVGLGPNANNHLTNAIKRLKSKTNKSMIIEVVEK
jgi:hypothetical protein